VDTRHPLGIISLGTFNNFAKSLRLPTTVDAAIRVIKHGTPRSITLGRVNGTVFLEAAAIGLFGAAIVAGDAAKDRAFGEFAQHAMRMLEARPFKYSLSGDIRGHGTAISLVFSNTNSIGSQLSVGDNTPENAYLELSFHTGRTDIVKRVLARALPPTEGRDGLGQIFKFRKLEVTSRPRTWIYADNLRLGQTPATVTAELSALKVILAR
jgi:diacylglycerol kinase (ATP)